MKLQLNSIVSYYTPSLDLMIGVVVEVGESDTDIYGKSEQMAKVYFGSSKFIVISEALLTVINNNFLTAQNYMIAYVQFQTLYNKKIEAINTNMVDIAKTIKPVEQNEYYSFGGDYYSDKILINIKTLSTGKVQLEFNNERVNKLEAEKLLILLDWKIVGLEVQQGSFKIGKAIGSKDYLKDILKKYIAKSKE